MTPTSATDSVSSGGVSGCAAAAFPFSIVFSTLASNSSVTVPSSSDVKMGMSSLWSSSSASKLGKSE